MTDKRTPICNIPRTLITVTCDYCGVTVEREWPLNMKPPTTCGGEECARKRMKRRHEEYIKGTRPYEGLIKIGDAMERLGRKRDAMRAYERSGRLVPVQVGINGTRYYRPEDVDKLAADLDKERDMRKGLMSSGQVAALFDVDRHQPGRWAAQGKLPFAYRDEHGRYFFNREDVLAKSVEGNKAAGLLAPDGFDCITEYKQLTEYTDAFAAGKIGFLLLIGSPGSGKSYQIRQQLKEGGGKHIWIDNHASNLGLYCSVHDAHNLPVVLDDVNHFLVNKQACSLLKAITQTDAKRNVSWESAVKYLEEREVPRRFTTSSPICFIGNTWNAKNADCLAIQDRSLPVAFYPSAKAIHERVIELGWCDKDIIDFVGQYLTKIPQPSMREYFVAGTLKKAGMEWKRKMFSLWNIQDQSAA